MLSVTSLSGVSFHNNFLPSPLCLSSETHKWQVREERSFSTKAPRAKNYKRWIFYPPGHYGIFVLLVIQFTALKFEACPAPTWMSHVDPAAFFAMVDNERVTSASYNRQFGVTLSYFHHVTLQGSLGSLTVREQDFRQDLIESHRMEITVNENFKKMHNLGWQYQCFISSNEHGRLFLDLKVKT